MYFYYSMLQQHYFKYFCKRVIKYIFIYCFQGINFFEEEETDLETNSPIIPRVKFERPELEIWQSWIYLSDPRDPLFVGLHIQPRRNFNRIKSRQ